MEPVLLCVNGEIVPPLRYYVVLSGLFHLHGSSKSEVGHAFKCVVNRGVRLVGKPCLQM